MFIAAQQTDENARLVQRNEQLRLERDQNLHAYQKLTGESAGERMTYFALLSEAKTLLLGAMAESVNDDAIEKLIERIDKAVPREADWRNGNPLRSYADYEPLPSPFLERGISRGCSTR